MGIAYNTKIPILQISDTKDLMTDTQLLNSYVKAHDARVSSTWHKYWNAYACKASILDTSIVPAKAINKPDHRIAVNYPRYIVDTYNGFARGIPVKISYEEPEIKADEPAETNDNIVDTREDNISAYIDEVCDNNEIDDVNAEVHKSKCIFGEAYQIAYVNEDSEIGVITSDPLESFPVYDNGIRPKVRYFIRTYYDENNKRHGTISDDTNIKYFDFDGGIHFTEERPHGFKGVPVVVYTLNSARIGLIEIVLPMCDAYDKAISEKMNDVDAFADAIMKILGAHLSEDQLQTLRDKRIINFSGKDGTQVVVDFLSRPSGDSTQEHLLERLERLIFTVSMVCNVSDNNFATSSGIALKMKMQPMSNLAAGDWRKDKASMKLLWKLIFSNPVNTVPEDAWANMQFTSTLNYPDDQSDAAETAKKLEGIVSRRTQISVLPASIVPDVDKELDRIAEEEAEAEKEKATATEEQIEALNNAKSDAVTEEIVVGEKENS